MNSVLFAEHTQMLEHILDRSYIPGYEKDYRKKQLHRIYQDMESKKQINQTYYQQSHEIRSLDFLAKFGDVEMACDSRNESGCDFLLNKHYQIECVCSSTGDRKKNGLINFQGDGLFDYGKKEPIILTRFTQSINEKLKFYNNHIEKKTINKVKPYIIMLGMGELFYEAFPLEFGFLLNKILFGAGCERWHLDIKGEKIIKKDYSHNIKISNHNNAPIHCNIFSDPYYSCISAIIFATANLEEPYNKDNTFLFINPFADVKTKAKDFDDMVYWRKSKNNEYLPRYKGKDINYNRFK